MQLPVCTCVWASCVQTHPYAMPETPNRKQIYNLPCLNDDAIFMSDWTQSFHVNTIIALSYETILSYVVVLSFGAFVDGVLVYVYFYVSLDTFNNLLTHNMYCYGQPSLQHTKMCTDFVSIQKGVCWKIDFKWRSIVCSICNTMQCMNFTC